MKITSKVHQTIETMEGYSTKGYIPIKGNCLGYWRSFPISPYKPVEMGILMNYSTGSNGFFIRSAALKWITAFDFNHNRLNSFIEIKTKGCISICYDP